MNPSERNEGLSFRTTVILAAIIALLHLTLAALSDGKESILPIKDGFTTITSGLAAAVLTYTAHRSAGRSKKAWTMIAAAMWFNTFGELSWSIIEVVLHQNPFPSVADIGYLMFYPLFALGIFLLPEVRFSPREKIKILLDAAIVIVSVTLVFWVLLIGPIVVSINIFSLESAVSLAYAVMDLILFFSLIELLFKKLDSREQGPFIILAISSAMLILSDVIFSIQIQQGTYVSGSLLDSGWVVSYILIGLAGILQINTPPLDRSRTSCFFQNRRANWTHNLPFLGIGAVFLLFVWGQEFSRLTNYSFVTTTFGLFFVLMFIRQKVVFDESNQLLAMTQSEMGERSRAEDALSKSEKEKAAILSGLRKVSVEYLDPLMRIIWVNSPVQKHLGIREDEIKEKHCLRSFRASISPVKAVQPSRPCRPVSPKKENLSPRTARPGYLEAALSKMTVRWSLESST